jgi:HEAT repeat protein
MTDGQVPKLVESLEWGSLAQRRAAAEKLAQLESEARGAAVPLVAMCHTDDESLREWVTAALEGLGPPEVSDVGKLAALVGRPSLDVAYWAATLLGRLEAAAAPAVPNLAEALTTHPETAVRQRAAWALGKIGPAAKSARDALTQAAESSDRRLARLAQEAISHLE